MKKLDMDSDESPYMELYNGCVKLQQRIEELEARLTDITCPECGVTFNNADSLCEKLELRQENKRLRDALQEIINFNESEHVNVNTQSRKIARQALKEGE